MVRIRSKYTHPEFQYACFCLDGVEFGINVKCVKEIIRYRDSETREGMPPFIEGVINLRSMEVPVVDLRKRLSMDPAVNRPTRFVVAAVDGHIACFAVDEVRDIITGGKELKRREKAGEQAPWDGSVDFILETGQGSVRILDLASLFSPEELAFFDTPLPK